MGEEAVFTGLRNFYKKFPFQHRTYEEFFACIQEETKENVLDYMNQWMYSHT